MRKYVVEDIAVAVGTVLGLSRENIRTKKKRADILTDARQLVALMSHRFCQPQPTYADIGDVLDRRHDTVKGLKNLADERLKKDKDFQRIYLQCVESLSCLPVINHPPREKRQPRKHVLLSKPKGPDERAKRRCLGCGKMFMSEWKGNRQCRSCKERKAYGQSSGYWF